MELRHLRYFAAVAETCHFGRAAEQVHVAQPALSQAIRQLEAELEVTLFNRTTRQVGLTPAGVFLQAQVVRLLRGIDDTVRDVRRIDAGRFGLLRLGLTGTAGFSHLPAIARLIRAQLPGVALEIQGDLLTGAQCDRLRAGSLDLGVLRPPASGDGITVCRMEAEPLILALPADHRLVDEPVCSMTDLRSESFVVYDQRDSVVGAAVRRSCEAAGFAPQRLHEVPGTAPLLALVAAGLGVALVPAGARCLPLDGVVFRDLDDAGSVELALAWHRQEHHPVVESVVQVLREAGLAEPAPAQATAAAGRR